MNKCDKCGSDKITYYRQQIKGGRIVVTARCENWHHPITGKPFYPVYKFDMGKLPMLPEQVEKEIPKRQLSWEEQLREDYENERVKPYQPYRNFPLEIK